MAFSLCSKYGSVRGILVGDMLKGSIWWQDIGRLVLEDGHGDLRIKLISDSTIEL